ncbi:hypothetical protein LCGC14_0434380 [marine sediment metagenome]|uniref:Uncharacterized protein n=1 Tax=marine sediment metagenome TaxID=412755 RepID=A0A0F9VWJ2_9ZZZZ
MAITWEVEITIISIPTKEVSVIATRTDDVSGEVKTYTVPRAPVETTEQKLAIMDEIWEKYQAELNAETVISAFIGTLETQAKTNLEARE